MLDPNYYATANDEILVAVQIESDLAIKNLEDILSVSGVDACYAGPMDLSSNMGLGIPPNWNDSRYQAAFDKVIEMSKKKGIPSGFYGNKDNIQWAVEKGFKLNTVGDADSFLVQGAQSNLALARKAMTA